MPKGTYLLEVTAYDPTLPGTRSLYFSSGRGFTTKPSEAPASQLYDRVLAQPLPIKRDIFGDGSTFGRSRISFGDIELYNTDGRLDVLLTYGYGRSARVLWTPSETPAYPGSFYIVWAGTIQQATAQSTKIKLKTRDLQADLELPLQTTKYAGTNALPAGLEGTDDLKGKPKPYLIGSALNVPAVCVNTSKRIYQVHDGAVQSIASVYDSGLGLDLGFKWTRQTTGRSGSYTGCGAGNGLFLIFGADGVLATSSDKITWTARTSGLGVTERITGHAYGAGLHVIVSDANKIFTSVNGTTGYTSRTSAFVAPNSGIFGVLFANGLFVAWGETSQVMTSPDGINWTLQTVTGVSGIVWRCAAYGVGVYALAGDDGTNGFLATSQDGIDWTVRSVNATVTGYASIAFGNDTFVLIGFYAGAAVVFVSADGLVWLKTVGNTNVTAAGLAFANGIFATASGLEAVFWTSRDGLSWSSIGNPLVADSAQGICTDGTDFLVVGESAAIAYSIVAAFTSLTELEDDSKAPAWGFYNVYLAGGYFRLGSPPAGQVTSDVLQGASAAARTAGQEFATVMVKAGKASGTAYGNYHPTDITDLDTANASVIGDWISEGGETFAQVLDRIANSVGAWWGLDRNGVYRIKRLVAPSGSPVAVINANDILKDQISRVSLNGDDSKGLPWYRTVLKYQKNYAVQSGDGLAGRVTDVRRLFLSNEYREVVATDAAVQTFTPLAVETIIETLLQSSANAATEAARLQALRGVLRHAYDVTVQLTADFVIVDLGDVVTLQHPRFGLSAGVLCRVMSVSPDAANDRVTFRLWR